MASHSPSNTCRARRWSPRGRGNVCLTSPPPSACASALHFFARQFAGLFDPIDELRFIERLVLVDVEVTHVRVLGFAGRLRTQRAAIEECHLHVLVEAVKT